jgi:glycosyltransferase involved in cell wall biosynthesis
MKILFSTPYYAPEYKFGGPPRKIESHARHLTRRGHTVEVITFNSQKASDDSRQFRDEDSVQYLPWIGSSTHKVPIDLRPLRAAIKKADVLHCFGLYNVICPAAAFFAHQARVPFFVEPMGMSVPRVRSLLSKRIYNATITRWMFSRAHSVIATSELEACEISAAYPWANVIVRRNGIELNGPASVEMRQMMRNRWRIAPAEHAIGYIGRISANKGLLPLVAAFEKLRWENVKLVIAGPVSDRAYMRRLQQVISNSRRNAHIIVADALFGEEYRAALSALDAFILPSESENFGNAAAEAADAGVPVVVTRQCGVAPLVDMNFGLAVEQGARSLAEGIEAILSGEWQHRQYDPRLVKALLSWDAPVSQMERLYEQAIRDRPFAPEPAHVGG